MKTYKELITEGITKPVPISTVERDLNSARSKVVGKVIKPAALAKEIEKTVGRKYSIEVSVQFAPSLGRGEMSANAYYDQEADLEGERAIEIELLISDKDRKGLDIGNEGFDALISNLAKVIVHEMLHKAQAMKRSFVKPKRFQVGSSLDPKIAQAQEYMGNSDEIEAYGHNIAVELLKSFGSRKDALTALRNFVRIPPDKSPDLFAYLTVFGMDKNHPVLKKLINKVVLYLKKLDEAITIPIEIGDTVLGGKFKNKKMEVKKIGKNEKGDITINDRPLLKFRIVKDV